MALKKIYVEITNICNRSCSFCAGTLREGRFMTGVEFEYILKAIRDYPGHIYPHVLGEPLLHPELYNILELCSRYGRFVNLATNGELLRLQGAYLLRYTRKISISLHCADSEEEMLNILNDALELYSKREGNSPIMALRLWRGENAFILNEISKRFPKRQEFLRNGHISFKLAPELYLDLAPPFVWPKAGVRGVESNKTDTKPRFCRGLRDQIAILSDGTVCPCCLDAGGELALGNIFQESLETILGSPRAVRIYNGFSSSAAVEDLCKSCESL